MLEALVTAAAFLTAIITGRFYDLVIFFGLVPIIGLLAPVVLRPGIYGFVTVISVAIMVSNASSLSFIFPGLIILVLRFVCKDAFFKNKMFLWVGVLPAALLLLLQNDRDCLAFAWLLLGITLPVPFVKKIEPSDDCPKRSALLCSILAIMTFCLFYVWPARNGEFEKTVVLRSGSWANPEVREKPDDSWDMENMYGYTELRRLLDAEVINIGELSNEIAEAWIITPTTPLKDEDATAIANWVAEGGHLIVVTDHTDIFGHARSIKPLLNEFGLVTSTTAFIPKKSDDGAATGFGKVTPLKTSNTQSGSWLWPVATARWYEEDIDYSGKNFFGNLTPSVEDGEGRRTIGGRKSHGAGTVTIFGDSTIFANFAIYQPPVIPLLEHLRSPGIFHKIFFIGSILLVLGSIIFFFTGQSALLYAIPIIGLLGIFDNGSKPVIWPKNFAFSGDPAAVSEFGEPTERISTAYSSLFLSNLVPRWVDASYEGNDGIWISKNPPPNKKWRWLDLDPHKNQPENKDNVLYPLLEKIGAAHPESISSQTDYRHTKIRYLWTDSVIGDWWFDRGISRSKQDRLQCFANWVASQPLKHTQRNASFNKDKLVSYWLIVDGGTEIRMTLPELHLELGQEIYLGRGVSAMVVRPESELMLLGGKSFTESWGGPYSWILVPEAKEPPGDGEISPAKQK